MYIRAWRARIEPHQVLPAGLAPKGADLAISYGNAAAAVRRHGPGRTASVARVASNN